MATKDQVVKYLTKMEETYPSPGAVRILRRSIQRDDAVEVLTEKRLILITQLRCDVLDWTEEMLKITKEEIEKV